MLTDLLRLANDFPPGQVCSVGHDGFIGTVQGYYITREGKPGIVLQGEGNRVVHVYGTKWFPKEDKPHD